MIYLEAKKDSRMRTNTILHITCKVLTLKRYTGNKVPQNIVKEVSKKCVGAKCPAPLPPNTTGVTSSEKSNVSQNASKSSQKDPIYPSATPQVTPPFPPSNPVNKDFSSIQDKVPQPSILQRGVGILNEGFNNHISEIKSQNSPNIAAALKNPIETSASQQATDFTETFHPSKQSFRGPVNSHTVKDLPGNTFSTIITNNTTADQIDVPTLLEEGRKRLLVKNDDGHTAVLVQTTEGSEALLGGSKHKVKLTPLGHAYHTQVTEKDVDKEMLPPPKISSVENLQFMIVVPPIDRDNTFIETGKQRHLFVTYNSVDGQYYATAYLTSKTSGKFFSETQYKRFEDEQENKVNNKPNKTQYFVPLENAQRIDPEDIVVVKYSEEYLASIPEKTLENLCETVKEHTEVPAQHFNKLGVTKEQKVDMCIQYDNNFNNNKKHPQTPDQLKVQEQGKFKQKALQEEKAKLKSKNSLNKHDNPFI